MVDQALTQRPVDLAIFVLDAQAQFLQGDIFGCSTAQLEAAGTEQQGCAEDGAAQQMTRTLQGHAISPLLSVGDDIDQLARHDDHLARSEEHTSELQSRPHLVCRLLLEKKKKRTDDI